MTFPLRIIVVCSGLSAVPLFGQTWVQTSAPSNKWYSVCSTADGAKLVAVANPGQVYSSVDSGTNWTLTSAPSNAWTSVACSADGRTVVGGASGAIYTSADWGGSWNSNTVPWIPASTNAVLVAASTDGSNLLAVVQRIGFFTSTNAGGTWVSNSVLANNGFWISAASSADGIRLWAVNDSYPHIWVSTNGGIAWTATTAFNSNWRAVSPTADGRRLVGVDYGWGVYISTNSGQSWTKTTAPSIPGQNWQAAASSADGVRLVATAGVLFTGNRNGPIYTSTNFGTTWTSNSAPLRTWTAVASSADGHKLVAVANGGGIYTSKTTSLPKLNITPSGSGLNLSWGIPSSDFVLQSNLDLFTTPWTTLTNTPTLNLTNLQNEIVFPRNADKGFYRLANP